MAADDADIVVVEGGITMRCRFLASVVLALGIAPPIAAFPHADRAPAYTFRFLDAPGADPCSTEPMAVNDRGEIVGTYSRGKPKGFALDGGRWTTIQPGDDRFGSGTTVLDVNDRGTMVGISSTVEIQGSFVLDRSGARPFHVPFPDATRTTVQAINDAGTIVGLYETGEEGCCPDTLAFHSFAYHAGAFGSVRDATGHEVFPYRVNDRGDLLAIYELRPHEPAREQVFCRSGVCEPITLPVPDVHDVDARGLDDRGDIVGTYRDEAGSLHGYLLRDGQVTTIDAGDSSDTVVSGVNDRGWLVGYVTGTVCHGFLATPRHGAPLDHGHGAG